MVAPAREWKFESSPGHFLFNISQNRIKRPLPLPVSCCWLNPLLWRGVFVIGLFAVIIRICYDRVSEMWWLPEDNCFVLTFFIFFMRYIVGIIVTLVGAAVVLKTEWIIQNFGTSAWAEAKFGTSGGSRTFYKLIGIVFIFFGFLLITNLVGGFLEGTIGKVLVR